MNLRLVLARLVCPPEYRLIHRPPKNSAVVRLVAPVHVHPGQVFEAEDRVCVAMDEAQEGWRVNARVL